MHYAFYIMRKMTRRTIDETQYEAAAGLMTTFCMRWKEK